MERYVCVHGHFYQPPRENPWLEAVELQDSAHPYHDWNERITAECYAPNSASRILDSEGYIREIINNYSRISFNFGPTLLSWMEQNAPDVYDAILSADRESQWRFSGHGSAIAQVYNHMILPLASRRDRETQVRWGIRDFEYRFGRKPEGMWLAESAVNTETLEVLADHGILFTILAPNQAHRVRKKSGGAWRDVSGSRIDPTRAYECRLHSGNSIAVFFYDGPISQAVAFEGLLASGERFAHRLMSGFSDKRTWSQLMHIATDGETYGHHHKFGDMALCYALHYIEENKHANLTNYGAFLERFPPTHVVEIYENSSWSCAHGVERWRSDCGCNSGGRGGWNQAWRGPLRDSLNWLRDTIRPHFEKAARELLHDPWIARDAYIDVILDRTPARVDEFLRHQSRQHLSAEEKQRALKLLELQRFAMLMYTSCGWFFDEISGIESVQVIQYAGRAIQLAEELFQREFESIFLNRLQLARSNIEEHCDGKCIYEKFVKPGMVDLRHVAAHYAISALFIPPDQRGEIYSYRVEDEERTQHEAGAAKLSIGRALFRSEVTHDAERFAFVVLHFGDHNLTCGIASENEAGSFDDFVSDLTNSFNGGEITECLRRIDRHFKDATYSLKSLFKDQQRRILNSILQARLDQASANLRLIFEQHAPLISYLTSMNAPQPPVLRAMARFAVSADLRRALSSDRVDLSHVRALLADAKMWNIELDVDGFQYEVNKHARLLAEIYRTAPMDQMTMENLSNYVEAMHMLPFPPNLWYAQNVYDDLMHTLYPSMADKAASGDDNAQQWVTRFRLLGERLRVRLHQ